MTRRIVLRPRAQADIDGIWDYTADQWNMDQADDYVAELKEKLLSLATHPLMGSDCSYLAEGLRKQRAGSHNIFYLHDDNVIDAVRILHKRMDATQHL